MKNRSGWTLIEAIVSVVVLLTIALVAAKIGTPITTFYKRSIVRQKMNTESRAAMTAMVQALQLGKASSLKISTGPATPVVPNSRVDFDLLRPKENGTTGYAIYVDANHQLELVPLPLGATAGGKVLADNVMGLIFSGDSNDPAIVYITLQIEAGLDATGTDDKISKIQILNQEVHMVVNQ
jgi:type II secretory pathway pseudopilin PulG